MLMVYVLIEKVFYFDHMGQLSCKFNYASDLNDASAEHEEEEEDIKDVEKVWYKKV